ncbi:hypothetical protein WN51_13234 [Melipona quadrifasciata]|uniref:Uncharacterized protein n=1 Tax=Melipona quadrifasciata TaxID=166423 RepID=A0A0N0BH11_9HYME|nr:hypothetical protein WN51_13234 [Melipona quadrifasciata]
MPLTFVALLNRKTNIIGMRRRSALTDSNRLSVSSPEDCFPAGESWQLEARNEKSRC